MDFTKEKVYEIILSHPNGNIEENQFRKKFSKLYKEIINLSFPEEFKWIQKLYHYFHNDLELNLGHCIVCGKSCKFISFIQGYNLHCSPKCTNLDKNVRLKMEQTLYNNYGVTNPSKSKEIQQKKKETCLMLYGKENYTQTDEFKNWYKKMCQLKYNCDNAFQSEEIKEKIKQTCQNKFGCDLYVLSEAYRLTCLNKYGVENFSQSHKHAQKRKKRIKYNNLTFDSTWEVKVYQYCQENDIPCEYQPDIQFIYFYNGKEHIYQPDFLINGKLYEVKGDHFFDGNKMINPFDRTQDGLFEMKHQCMIKNNVVILKGENIKNLKEVIF